MPRFTLKPGRWYACEIIGDEFDDDRCSYSPIKVERIEPGGTGDRSFRLHFYHANYPAGVQDKVYELQTIERGDSFLLARAKTPRPHRFLQIYDIDGAWFSRHFAGYEPDEGDIQGWLSRNV